MEILNIKRLKNSFACAFQGIKSAFHEQVFRICCAVALLVIILMITLEMTFLEKAIIIFAITLVLSFELINSRIERILNLIQPGFDKKVRIIKDISAGAVLISIFGAVIAGILIFYPYFIKLF